MTQPASIHQPEQPPAICPICHTWVADLPYAARHTTPIPAGEALGIMVIGFWLASRGHAETDLCQQHQEMLIRLDVQKHTREEWQRSEAARIIKERELAEIEAAKPKYPTPQHEQIAAKLLGRIGTVNAPPPVQQRATMAQTTLTADPNTFPCPDCGKPVRNGEVHGCAAPEPKPA